MMPLFIMSSPNYSPLESISGGFLLLFSSSLLTVLFMWYNGKEFYDCLREKYDDGRIVK